MANLNKVYLIGNMTRDAELRYTPKGTPLVDISLAVNRVTGGGESGNERKEEVIFVDITFWGRLAEIINEYGGKGKPLFVEGRLHLDTWEDKTTHQKRSRLRVVAESMQLLGSRRGAGDNGKSAVRGAPSSRRDPAGRRSPRESSGADVDPENEPF
jgi:single-strand DNA-binding protein